MKVVLSNLFRQFVQVSMVISEVKRLHIVSLKSDNKIGLGLVCLDDLRFVWLVFVRGFWIG